MSQNREHIDIELLRKYYNNELTSIDRNRLEKQALMDPFLQDAMDGFDENPGSFDAFYSKNKKKFKSNTKYTVLIGIGVLIALFGITNFISNKTKITADDHAIVSINETNEIEILDDLNSENGIDNEMEILPIEIEEMKAIEKKEQVSAKQLVDNQTEQEGMKENADIKIDDEPVVDTDFKSEKEDIAWNNKGLNIPPTLYIYDLSVVDYRKVKRENASIKYKRFELTGVSADQESEESGTDLTEIEVEVPYTIYLQKSMSFFDEQLYKQALNRYLIILEQYPTDLNALFYGGLSYYNLGKYEKSIVFFDLIQASEFYVFNEESLWYKAKSLVKLNKKKAADVVLNQIIIRGGFYTKDAIKLKAGL